MSKSKSIHRILVYLYSAYLQYTSRSVRTWPLHSLRPRLFRAGYLLGGLTRHSLLAIFGVTLSNSAIAYSRADNGYAREKWVTTERHREKNRDSFYPWLASAVVSSASPLLSLVNTHVRHQ